jgi:hypothetical protein
LPAKLANHTTKRQERSGSGRKKAESIQNEVLRTWLTFLTAAAAFFSAAQQYNNSYSHDDAPPESSLPAACRSFPAANSCLPNFILEFFPRPQPSSFPYLCPHYDTHHPQGKIHSRAPPFQARIDGCRKHRNVRRLR